MCGTCAAFWFIRLLADLVDDNWLLYALLSCCLILTILFVGRRVELAELLVGKWIDTRIDLGIGPGERFAHDRHNFFLSSDRVRDHLLFEWLYRSLSTLCILLR